MLNLPSITYHPLAHQDSFRAECNGEICTVGSLRAQARRIAPDGLHLTLNESNPLAFAILAEYLFSHQPELKHLKVAGLEPISFFSRLPEVSREEFFQWPLAWHHRGVNPPAAEIWNSAAERPHPVRPVVHRGLHYRRYVPEIQKTVSFRTADPSADAQLFHEWHNSPRVAALWELNKPLAELQTYLEKGIADPHQIPMIFELDGEPAGYFEIYWTPEDRLGPHYSYDPFDRGFHFLIGPDKFLGTKNTYAALQSVSHFLFIDDIRTRRVMGEPRADNERVLRYIELVPGWKKLKEFDFPHKRAALVGVERQDFFRRGGV